MLEIFAKDAAGTIDTGVIADNAVARSKDAGTFCSGAVACDIDVTGTDGPASLGTTRVAGTVGAGKMAGATAPIFN